MEDKEHPVDISTPEGSGHDHAMSNVQNCDDEELCMRGIYPSS